MATRSNNLDPLTPASPVSGATVAPQPVNPFRPGAEPAIASAVLLPRLGSRPSQMPSDPVTTDNSVEPRNMIVGAGISVSGKISSCDRLVIEGSVQASLQNCRHMKIEESGFFNGHAEIDEAEIRGRFEGDFVVRKRLLIRASGNVSGTISYKEIEIEVGGKILGTIQASG
jgi:cytoskeletal protein CcmA (bactofilin family)